MIRERQKNLNLTKKPQFRRASKPKENLVESSKEKSMKLRKIAIPKRGNVISAYLNFETYQALMKRINKTGESVNRIVAEAVRHFLKI